jgi:glyceraldehyde 3-phosphate dehydrogenase
MAAAPSIFSSRHVEAPLVKSPLCLADSLARAAKERKGSRAAAYLRQAGPALHEEKAVANGLQIFNSGLGDSAPGLPGGRMAIKVGINGFGRIGRNIVRTAIDDKDIQFVAVNDITDSKTLAHLLKYDSILGNLPHAITHTEDTISIEGKAIKVFKVKDPVQIDWASVGADIVVESTGLFTKGEQAKAHLRGSVKKVIISAPADGPDATFVLGVNHHTYDPAKHNVISNASCTTNCLAPVAKVLHETFGIHSGTMTTIHSYTNDQKLLDLPHKDLRRARAAAINMIPSSTGAAKALHLVLPELKGKLDGYAMRVPTPNVSVVDLTVFVEKPATKDSVNAALKAAANGPLKGILAYTEEELVSADFKGNSNSSIVDSEYTKVVGDKCVKVLAWYDNEWGYSCRCRDLIKLLASKF